MTRIAPILLSLLLCCSCATQRPAQRQPPAEASINPDAGRGGLVLVTLHLQNGEALPFVLDTGSPGTLFDKSLVPKLGPRLPLGTWTVPLDGAEQKSPVYREPKLYLGSTRLKTGGLCAAVDLQPLSKRMGRPIMGILAMDCLKHYCIQLDFQVAKMRFLHPSQFDPNQLGKAFPLKLSLHDELFTEHPGLAGGKTTRLLVDTGWNGDGSVERDAIQGDTSGPVVHLPQCVWEGQTYTNLNIGTGGNILGLGFLARHLVTFDFPRRIMYLKQTSSGPLTLEEFAAALNFMRALKKAGRTPGWSKNDKGRIRLEAHPDSHTFGFSARKQGDPTVWHYTVTRPSKDSPWKLLKAWQTDPNGKILQELPVTVNP